MVSVMAVVPSIGESPYLSAMLDVLMADKIPTYVVVNQEDVEPVPEEYRGGPLVRQHDMPGKSIYETWNWGIQQGAEDGYDAVAILNDDCTLMPWAVTVAAELMVAEPRYWAVGLDYFPGADSRKAELREVVGTYRHGGVGGFAFVVNPALCPLVDTQFEWWGGDDDMMFTIAQRGGKVAIAEGCAVSHVAETTASKYPWTQAARARDRARFVAKWGEAQAW